MRRHGVLAISLFVAVVLAGGCTSNDNATPVATTTTNAPNPAVVQIYADGAAIQALAEYLNNAYAVSPADASARSAASTYLVWNGAYTAEQCASYLRSQMGVLAGARFSQTFRFENTLRATPNRAIDRGGGSPGRSSVHDHGRHAVDRRPGQRDDPTV